LFDSEGWKGVDLEVFVVLAVSINNSNYSSWRRRRRNNESNR